MPVVGAVRVAVVDVVGVITVIDGGVTAAGAVLVGVVLVDGVFAHESVTSLLPDCGGWRPAAIWATCWSAREYVASRPLRSTATSAGATQHPQVLGHERLAQLEAVNELVDLQGLVGQLDDDGQAGRRREHLEQVSSGDVALVGGGHERNISTC